MNSADEPHRRGEYQPMSSHVGHKRPFGATQVVSVQEWASHVARIRLYRQLDTSDDNAGECLHLWLTLRLRLRAAATFSWLASATTRWCCATFCEVRATASSASTTGGRHSSMCGSSRRTSCC